MCFWLSVACAETSGLSSGGVISAWASARWLLHFSSRGQLRAASVSRQQLLAVSTAFCLSVHRVLSGVTNSRLRSGVPHREGETQRLLGWAC